MARDLKQVTATGDVVTGPVYLHSVALASTAAGGSVVVRDGSGGAARLTLRAGTDGTAVWVAGSRPGVLFGSSLHATVAGTVQASFEYS